MRIEQVQSAVLGFLAVSKEVPRAPSDQLSVEAGQPWNADIVRNSSLVFINQVKCNVWIKQAKLSETS